MTLQVSDLRKQQKLAYRIFVMQIFDDSILLFQCQYSVDYHRLIRAVVRRLPVVKLQFLARDSMLSALYAIANPSVCPSAGHTAGSVKNG